MSAPHVTTGTVCCPELLLPIPKRFEPITSKRLGKCDLGGSYALRNAFHTPRASVLEVSRGEGIRDGEPLVRFEVGLEESCSTRVGFSKVELRLDVTSLRRPAEPLRRLNVVATEPLTLGVRYTQIELSIRVQSRHAPPPLDGLRVVALDAAATSVCVSEVDLSIQMTLVRRLAVPVNGLGVVLWYARPRTIQAPELVLRL